MRIRFSRLALFLLALCLPVSVLASGVDVEKVRKSGISTISVARAKKHVFFLAGMKCQGRASGEAGCDVARDYLVERLTEYGVEPCGENGTWLQTFPIRTGAFPGQRPAKGAEPPSMKPTSNVIGVVRGSDPELAKEAVILGGHYDHIGYKDLRKRKVFWGADDNASGTAAVLLAAQAFAEGEVRPKRSVIFLFFTGEERGLFGSKRYVSRPTWPIRDTVAMINLDMVGRNKPDEMGVYGITSSPDLEEIHTRHEKAARFRFKRKGGSIFAASDHYSFYQKQIPVLFFNSGLHPDYHDLDDEPKRINYGKVERIAEHCYRMIWDIAEAEGRPAYREVAPTGAAGVLGFRPVALSASELKERKLPRKLGAVEVGAVTADSPAKEGGVEPGDLVVGLAGKMLTDKDPLGELDGLADGLPKGRKAQLLVLRDGKRKLLTLPIR